MTTTERVPTATLGRRMLRAAPWLAILLITGTVQFVRDAPWDGVIFLTVAAVLAVDVVRPLPSWRRPRVARKLVVWLVVAAAGLLLVLMPRHSVGEGIVAIAIGLTALVFAWPDRPASARVADDRTIRRTGVLWAITALAVCVWELTSFVLGRIMPGGVIEHPAVSDLINPLLDWTGGTPSSRPPGWRSEPCSSCRGGRRSG